MSSHHTKPERAPLGSLVLGGRRLRGTPALILASTSSYRRAQLQELGLRFEVEAPEVDESKVSTASWGVSGRAAELSHLKAQSVQARWPESIVIGSDQICALEGQVFHKPQGKSEAIAHLRELRGRTHELHTGICVLYGKQTFEDVVVAKMKMRDLSEGEIQRYVEIDKPLDCCGSYKIEALGISLFESIETSDFTSIRGLPLIALTRFLRELGAEIP